MAIYNKARLIANSVTLDSYIRTLAFNHSAEEVDDTAMGDDTRTSAGGLQRWTIEAEFNHGGATGAEAAFATSVGKTITVVLRHTTTSTANSASNPRYSGSGLVTEYVPGIQGSVGDQKISSVSIVSAGTLTRAVT